MKPSASRVSQAARLTVFARLPVALLTGLLLLSGLPQDLAAAQEQTENSAPVSASPESAGDASARPDVEHIIRSFAAKEAEFQAARENYTYTQTVKVEEINSEGRPGGAHQVTTEIMFTPQGRRTEKVVYAPLSTLRRISMSPEDERDLRSIQPFVLTTDDLPKYDIRYQGRQKVDELDTYVFRIGPKQLVRGERYFDGMVWVDEQDLQIVKTYGKAVPDIRSGKNENLFPRFETYREQIDGKYWFPTWTEADDTLQFSSGAVRIRMLVRYDNYKQFKTETNIIYGDEAETPPQIQ